MHDEIGKATMMTELKSQDTSSSLERIDKRAEKKLLLKCDLHLIPMLGLLFLCAFIDRINIGNARIQGLEKDLKMKGHDYNVALLAFFPTYIVFEIPSNMILKKVRPSVWLSGLMFLWGIFTVCQGLTRSFGGLIACRVLLGTVEAGFVPGCIYLISMYYKRHEAQWRFSLFFCFAILAGAFSGLLAYGIAHMDGIGGYGGWRWIFILGGLFTVAVASVSWLIIPDWPETAKFLNSGERSMLLRRLAEDKGAATMDRIDKASTKRVFKDSKIYLAMLMYLGIVNTGYSTSFFTPTILKQLGWTSIRAQVYSIPIYIVAATFALVTAYLSDRLRHRFSFVMIGVLVATIGYAILLTRQQHVSVPARYMAVYLITTGGYIGQPVVMVWLANNLGGHYKRSVGTAFQIGFGNIGGIVASNIYLTDQAPYYRLGFGLSMGLVLMSGVAAVIMLVLLVRENRLRESGKRDGLLALPAGELGNLGDDHPRFRFTY